MAHSEEFFQDRCWEREMQKERWKRLCGLEGEMKEVSKGVRSSFLEENQRRELKLKWL